MGKNIVLGQSPFRHIDKRDTTDDGFTLKNAIQTYIDRKQKVYTLNISTKISNKIMKIYEETRCT